MTESNPVVFEDNWETYYYNAEEGPVFVTFFAGVVDLDRDAYPYCARIIIPIQEPGENGGPGDDEAEVLWALEDQLTAHLQASGVACVLVGRVTCDGVRELVFQLADWESFRPPVAIWMEQTGNEEIDVTEHDSWDFFDDCIWPNDEDWILIRDRTVVTGLIEAGSDPDKEHALEYVFVGTQPGLGQLAQQLKERGYLDYNAPTEPDQLIMVRRMPLDLPLVFEESLANFEACQELGLDFDGWGAAVIR